MSRIVLTYQDIISLQKIKDYCSKKREIVDGNYVHCEDTCLLTKRKSCILSNSCPEFWKVNNLKEMELMNGLSSGQQFLDFD